MAAAQSAALTVTVLALVMGTLMGACLVKLWQRLRRMGATLAIGVNPTTNHYYMEWRRPDGQFLPMRKQKADLPLSQEVVMQPMKDANGKLLNQRGEPIRVPPFMPKRGGVPLTMFDAVNATPLKVEEGIITKWTGFKWRALRKDIRWHQINNAGKYDLATLMKLALVGLGIIILGLLALGFIVAKNLPAGH